MPPARQVVDRQRGEDVDERLAHEAVALVFTDVESNPDEGEVGDRDEEIAQRAGETLGRRGAQSPESVQKDRDGDDRDEPADAPDEAAEVMRLCFAFPAFVTWRGEAAVEERFVQPRPPR